MDYKGSSEHTPDDPRETVAAVIKQLKSGSGSVSGTGPYSVVRGARATKYVFDTKTGEMAGEIAIHSDGESLHNDDVEWDALFKVSRADVQTLAETAPEKFRGDFVNILKAFDHEKAMYIEDQQRRALKILVGHFGTGIGVPLNAPERASFKKKPARHAGPGRN